jgi:hypothetical protein
MSAKFEKIAQQGKATRPFLWPFLWPVVAGWLAQLFYGLGSVDSTRKSGWPKYIYGCGWLAWQWVNVAYGNIEGYNVHAYIPTWIV